MLNRRLFPVAAGPAALAMALPFTGTAHELALAGLSAGGTAAAEVLVSLADKVREGREEQVLAAVAAAHGTGLAAGDLRAAAEDPYGRRVLTEVFAGAADATYVEKVIALGLYWAAR